MSDYAWFAVKGMGYLALIGFVCWVATSPWPLLALVFMPSWVPDKKESKDENSN
jgi:hypothetical protein